VRKGPIPRRIVIDGETYMWTATGNDGGVTLVVGLDLGERPKRPKRRDGKRVHKHERPVPVRSRMWTVLDHANIVSPSLVRRMIQLAIAEGWQPTGFGPARGFRRRGVFPDEPGSELAVAGVPPTHDALLTAIADAPDDDQPRLVYADWLLEQDGELERARGEYIALACSATRSPEADTRMQVLFQTHEYEWLGPIADVTHGKPRLWSRGALEGCSLERHERGVTAPAIGHPMWRTVRVLEARGYWLAQEDQLRLVCQPELAKLHGLYATSTFVEALADNRDAPRVTELAIHPISTALPGTLRALLAEHPVFARLRRLHLFQCLPDIIPQLMRPGLALVAVWPISDLPRWLTELDTRRATFDEVRFAGSVRPHLARGGLEATLRRDPADRWSVLEIRWTADDDASRRTMLIDALGALPPDRLTEVTLVGPELAELAGWIAAVRTQLKAQRGARIERRLA
jgi:uncharacterized protein (TIGR02996 family)